jgi:peroxiredoxin
MQLKNSVRAMALSCLVAVGSLALVACSQSAAPDSTFVLLDGSRQTTADLHGKVTLVNFWATSCTTCVAEMPEIVATYEKYQSRGFDTLAVAMSYDPPSYVVNFAETRKLPFKVALDNTGAVAKAWGDVRITPTTYIVDKQGKIVKTYVGAPNFAELHQLIERLLAEG